MWQWFYLITGFNETLVVQPAFDIVLSRLFVLHCQFRFLIKVIFDIFFNLVLTCVFYCECFLQVLIEHSFVLFCIKIVLKGLIATTFKKINEVFVMDTLYQTYTVLFNNKLTLLSIHMIHTRSHTTTIAFHFNFDKIRLPPTCVLDFQLSKWLWNIICLKIICQQVEVEGETFIRLLLTVEK